MLTQEPQEQFSCKRPQKYANGKYHRYEVATSIYCKVHIRQEFPMFQHLKHGTGKKNTGDAGRHGVQAPGGSAVPFLAHLAR